MKNQRFYFTLLFIMSVTAGILWMPAPSFAADSVQPALQQLNIPLSPDQTGAPAVPSIAVPFDLQKGRNLRSGEGKEGISEPGSLEKFPTEKTPAIVRPE